jgi:hypothetical protein
MENKYKAGDVVSDRIRPNQRLLIKRFLGNLYYCIIMENPKRKELVYLERDLKLDNSLE